MDSKTDFCTQPAQESAAFLQEIKTQLQTALDAFFPAAKLMPGDILVVGCSTSEIFGEKIGSGGSLSCAQTVFDTISDYCSGAGVFLAAQCCEHLNRALVLTKEACERHRIDEFVNVVPQIHAGGSFATAAYRSFAHPCVVEAIRADAGIDIGDTFIGMHLHPVAVPVRTGVFEIGAAHVTFARTRRKYIGGERAVYDPE